MYCRVRTAPGNEKRLIASCFTCWWVPVASDCPAAGSAAGASEARQGLPGELLQLLLQTASPLLLPKA